MLGIGNTVAYYIILHGCFYVLNTLKCRGQKKKMVDLPHPQVGIL